MGLAAVQSYPCVLDARAALMHYSSVQCTRCSGAKTFHDLRGEMALQISRGTAACIVTAAGLQASGVMKAGLLACVI